MPILTFGIDFILLNETRESNFFSKLQQNKMSCLGFILAHLPGMQNYTVCFHQVWGIKTNALAENVEWGKSLKQIYYILRTLQICQMKLYAFAKNVEKTVRIHTAIMRKTTMVICRAHKMQLYTYAISAIFEIKKWIFIGNERYTYVNTEVDWFKTTHKKLLRHCSVKTTARGSEGCNLTKGPRLSVR